VLLTALLFAQAAAAGSKEFCYVEERHNEVRVIRYIGDRACIDFTPPRRVSGIWIDQFEGSSFFEGLTKASQLSGREHTTWLTIDDETVVPDGFKREYRGNIYHVTFIGRTAKDMNRKPLEGYGHFGMSPGLVLVDRLLEWKNLGRIDAR
jgi:hypothetical protein